MPKKSSQRRAGQAREAHANLMYDDERPAMLRFAIGTRVECAVNDGWETGAVIDCFYAPPEFPRGRCAAYQCVLDSTGVLIYAPYDIASTIRLLDAAAREEHAMKCLVRSIAAVDMNRAELMHLVEDRLDLKIQPARRQEILRAAATFGRIPAMAWALQELQTPALEQDARGRTFLHLAVCAARHTAVQWIMSSLSGYDAYAKRLWGDEHKVLERDILEQLYVVQDDAEMTSLAVAASRGDVQMIKVLMPDYSARYRDQFLVTLVEWDTRSYRAVLDGACKKATPEALQTMLLCMRGFDLQEALRFYRRDDGVSALEAVEHALSKHYWWSERETEPLQWTRAERNFMNYTFSRAVEEHYLEIVQFLLQPPWEATWSKEQLYPAADVVLTGGASWARDEVTRRREPSGSEPYYSRGTEASTFNTDGLLLMLDASHGLSSSYTDLYFYAGTGWCVTRAWDGISVESLIEVLEEYKHTRASRDEERSGHGSEHYAVLRRVLWLRGLAVPAYESDASASRVSLDSTMHLLRLLSGPGQLLAVPHLELCLASNRVGVLRELVLQGALDLRMAHPVKDLPLRIPSWLLERTDLVLERKPVGQILLLIAASYGALTTFIYLASEGEMDISCDYGSGQNVMHIAASSHAFIIVKWLCVNGYSNLGWQCSASGLTPLQEAISSGDVESMQCLLSRLPDAQLDAEGRDWVELGLKSNSRRMRDLAKNEQAERWISIELPRLVRDGTPADALIAAAAKYEGTDVIGEIQHNAMFCPKSCAHWREFVLNAVIGSGRVDLLEHLLLGWLEPLTKERGYWGGERIEPAAPLISRTVCCEAARRHSLGDDHERCICGIFDQLDARALSKSAVKRADSTAYDKIEGPKADLERALASGAGVAKLGALVERYAELLEQTASELPEGRRLTFKQRHQFQSDCAGFFTCPYNPDADRKFAFKWSGEYSIDPNSRDSPLEFAIKAGHVHHIEWFLSFGSCTVQRGVDALFAAVTNATYHSTCGIDVIRYLIEWLESREADVSLVRQSRDALKNRGYGGGGLGELDNQILEEKASQSVFDSALDHYNLGMTALDHLRTPVTVLHNQIRDGKASRQTLDDDCDSSTAQVRRSWSVVEWLAHQPSTRIRSITSHLGDNFSRSWSSGNAKLVEKCQRGRQFCSHCFTTASLQLCKRCKLVSFCSSSCQEAAWRWHKYGCAPPGHVPEDCVLYEPVYTVVKLLVERGADPNCHDKDGCSLVQLLVNSLHLTTLRWLAIDCGVDIQGLVSTSGANEKLKTFTRALKDLQREQKAIESSGRPACKATVEGDAANDESPPGLDQESDDEAVLTMDELRSNMRSSMVSIRSGGIQAAIDAACTLRVQGNELIKSGDAATARGRYESAMEQLWPFESQPEAAWQLVLNLANHAQASIMHEDFERAVDSCDDGLMLLERFGTTLPTAASERDDKARKLQHRKEAALQRISNVEARLEAEAAAEAAADEAATQRAAQEATAAARAEQEATEALARQRERENEREREQEREARRLQRAAAAEKAAAEKAAAEKAAREKAAGERAARQAAEEEQRALERRAVNAREEVERTAAVRMREEAEAAARAAARAASVLERERIQASRRARRQARAMALEQAAMEEARREAAERAEVLRRAAWAESEQRARQARMEAEEHEADEAELASRISRRTARAEAEMREWRQQQEARQLEAALAESLSGPWAPPRVAALAGESAAGGSAAASAAGASVMRSNGPTAEDVCPCCLEGDMDGNPLHQACAECSLWIHLGCASQWRIKCRNGNVTGKSIAPTCPNCRAPF